MVTCLSGPEDGYLILFGLQIMLVFLSEAGHVCRGLWIIVDTMALLGMMLVKWCSSVEAGASL